MKITGISGYLSFPGDVLFYDHQDYVTDKVKSYMSMTGLNKHEIEELIILEDNYETMTQRWTVNFLAKFKDDEKLYYEEEK